MLYSKYNLLNFKVNWRIILQLNDSIINFQKFETTNLITNFFPGTWNFQAKFKSPSFANHTPVSFFGLTPTEAFSDSAPRSVLTLSARTWNFGSIFCLYPSHWVVMLKVIYRTLNIEHQLHLATWTLLSILSHNSLFYQFI